jgi:hypothetical protein
MVRAVHRGIALDCIPKAVAMPTREEPAAAVNARAKSGQDGGIIVGHDGV